MAMVLYLSTGLYPTELETCNWIYKLPRVEGATRVWAWWDKKSQNSNCYHGSTVSFHVHMPLVYYKQYLQDKNKDYKINTKCEDYAYDFYTTIHHL